MNKQAYLISNFTDIQASFVHDSNDAFVSLLNEFADDLIVKVVDSLPGDSFPLVLFLLAFENELDEQLLELLIAVVDAELLEAVGVEDLEPVDVQDADKSSLVAFVWIFIVNIYRAIYSGYYPGKQPLVDGFCEGVSPVLGFCQRVILLHDLASSCYHSLGQRGAQRARAYWQPLRRLVQRSFIPDY